MADLAVRTQDVTLRDETTGDSGSVNADNEQLTHDQHAIDQLEIIAGNTTSIDARTATSWQFFAQNDKAFAVSHTVQISGTAETNFILIKNPTVDHYLRVKEIIMSIGKVNVAGLIRIYKNPTITNDGTPLTVSNFRDNTVATIMQTYSVPITTSRGQLLETYGAFAGTVQRDNDLALILLPARSLLITIEPSTNNSIYTVDVTYAEEAITP